MSHFLTTNVCAGAGRRACGFAGRLATGLCAGVLVAGCSGRPPRVEAPEWDPAEFTERAFADFDANQDSVLERSELDAVPGLAAAFNRVDRDRDKRVTQDELRGRFEAYEKMRTGILLQSFEVTLNGRPLAGAKIEFIPESYQGDVLEIATGVTNDQGTVRPKVEGHPGMQIGFFRVKAYDPRSQNESELKLSKPVGVEVSPFTEIESENTSRINLRT